MGLAQNVRTDTDSLGETSDERIKPHSTRAPVVWSVPGKTFRERLCLPIVPARGDVRAPCVPALVSNTHTALCALFSLEFRSLSARPGLSGNANGEWESQCS
eukprot:1192709-Prorocentrum_minimum.AAC.1